MIVAFHTWQLGSCEKWPSGEKQRKIKRKSENNATMKWIK